MMDNATFRENMNAIAVAASKVSTQANQAQEPGIHDLLACLGDLAKENRGLSYQIRDNILENGVMKKCKSAAWLAEIMRPIFYNTNALGVHILILRCIVCIR